MPAGLGTDNVVWPSHPDALVEVDGYRLPQDSTLLSWHPNSPHYTGGVTDFTSTDPGGGGGGGGDGINQTQAHIANQQAQLAATEANIADILGIDPTEVNMTEVVQSIFAGATYEQIEGEGPVRGSITEVGSTYDLGKEGLSAQDIRLFNAATAWINTNAALQKQISFQTARDEAAARQAAAGGGGGGGGGGGNPERQEARAIFTALVPWLPKELRSVWIDAWIEHGNADVALGLVRADSAYDSFFPGIKRNDGSLRMTELEYFSTLDAFRDSLLDHQVNPEFFESQFVELIKGDVSAKEFRSRVSGAHERVISQETEVREAYATFYGTDMTAQAILASVLDPQIGEDIVNRRISVAEIGGEAALQKFTLGRQRADRLVQAGFGQSQAQDLFRSASESLTSLNRASQRNQEGAFGLNRFLDSQAFGVASERRSLRRTLEGEASRFSSTGQDVSRDEQRRVRGLAPR